MSRDDTLFYIQLLNSLVSAFSLIFLIIYVVKTWQMASATRRAAEATRETVEEMRESRDLETAPNVVVYFDVPTGEQLIYLVVKNLGKSVATNVRLRFEPPLQTSDHHFLENTSFLTEGITSMPPNYELRTLMDSTMEYFGNSTLPLRYRVSCAYYGGLRSNERIFEQELDLGTFKGMMFVRRKGLHELVEHIGKLHNEHKQLRNNVDRILTRLREGLLISNATFAVTTLDQDVERWEWAIRAKLREFTLLWYASENDRSTGLHLYSLQAHLKILADQLLTYVAHSPSDPTGISLEQVSEVAYRIYELSQHRFFMDAGASVAAFSELGDNVVQTITSITGSTTQIAPLALGGDEAAEVDSQS